MGMGERHWTDTYTPREIAQIKHAAAYADTYSDAGVPGHNHLVLIAKLIKDLDTYYTYIPEKPRVIAVSWSKDSNCWRDLMTGVCVELE